MGDEATGDLLVFSQVILSLQLSFAIIPLIHFVSDKSKMGDFAIPGWQKILSWLATAIIISLNINVVYNEISELIVNSNYPVLFSFTVVPFCVFCLFMLVYILVIPFITRNRATDDRGFHDRYKPLVLDLTSSLQRIAVTVDFGKSDNKAINKAVQLGNNDSTIILIHVLESTNAVVYGEDAFDHEREEDYQKLLLYQEQLTKLNIKTEIQLGFGSPKQAIPALIIKNKCDTVVMGTHGHRTVKDILLGSTIENIRHSIKVPLVLV
jgi:manganese transport protein